MLFLDQDLIQIILIHFTFFFFNFFTCLLCFYKIQKLDCKFLFFSLSISTINNNCTRYARSQSMFVILFNLFSYNDWKILIIQFKKCFFIYSNRYNLGLFIYYYYFFFICKGFRIRVSLFI